MNGNTSTTKGSITSVQAIYVPADDLTDPAPATAFAHLDATTVLTTASDARQTLAVDLLGRELGWTFEASHDEIVRASAAVVNDEPVALVQEAAGSLGDAICSLRRSEALRKNSTVTRKRTQLTEQLHADNFRCETGRVARTYAEALLATAEARGEADAEPWLSRFYFGESANGERSGLKAMVSDIGDIDARDVNSIPLGADPDGVPIVARVGRYGAYLQRGDDTAAASAWKQAALAR